MVENAGKLVTRDELMQAIWPGIFVSDESIAQCVMDVRRVLGDGEQLLLRTLPRRGYLLEGLISRAYSAAASVTPMLDTVSECIGPLLRPATGRPMVVVVPLETFGPDLDQDYFAEGLTADLVADLTRFQDLHVVTPPRRASQTAKTLPPEASYVLSGSVRRAAGRIRVTVQLKSARTGVGLWAERFDRPFDDLFIVQDELASRIAALLDTQVSHDGLRRARRQPVSSLDAHDLCLQARALLGNATEAGTLAAGELLNSAIAADPDYAPAYAWKSQVVQRAFTLG